MTTGFASGLLLGAFLLKEYAPMMVWMSIILATISFHYTFSTDSKIKMLIAKVIKKGS
jgi:hypothetical protein